MPNIEHQVEVIGGKEIVQPKREPLQCVVARWRLQ
jgi:hypothetical protein